MAAANLDLVRALFERFNGNDREALFELFSEDFVADVPASLSAEPDRYEGHAGLRRYLDGFEGLLEEVRFVPLELHEEGEQVIADTVLKGRGAASGIEVEQRSAMVVWIEQGKVKRMQAYPDLDAAREALGRSG
jgi:ketosteroid isomerase-like protein